MKKKLPIFSGFGAAAVLLITLLVRKAPIAWPLHHSQVCSPWRIRGTGGDCTSPAKARLSGIYFSYDVSPPADGKRATPLSNGIVNLGPDNIAPLLRDWDQDTALIPAGNEAHNSMAALRTPRYFAGAGFWHVYSATEGTDLYFVPPAQATLPSRPALLTRKYLELDFSFPHFEKEVWEISGAIPARLYLPLRHLLSTCALYPDPDRPNIRPQLDIPVIVGKDANGKDIIQMKPLITKVVKDDGQPIQVFTGNKKEDQYFDKKFNSP